MRKALFAVVVLLVLFFVALQTNILKPSNQTIIQKPTLSPTEQSNQTSTACTGNPTPSQTEGPYYKTGSPQRNNITQGISGEKLTVTGFVYDKNCKPIANAWLDFWQADANGVYDNEGFKLRGHQFANENGMYHLETIVPARYGTRPPHIHVKVKSPTGLVLTSQMYFPNDPKNQTDPIFNQELIMNVKDSSNGKVAEFNFVLNQ